MRLYLVWERDWATLSEDVNSEHRISEQIVMTRNAVLDTVDALR
jgi:hypothetical protein